MMILLLLLMMTTTMMLAMTMALTMIRVVFVCARVRVRMQVRHVYDPLTRARLGYHADREYCALANLSAEEASLRHPPPKYHIDIM
jgi:hypothetical protein